MLVEARCLKPADEVGVDASAGGRALLHGADEIPEADRCLAAAILEYLATERIGGGGCRLADRSERPRFLCRYEAITDRRLASEEDFSRRRLERCEVLVAAAEAGRWRLRGVPATAREDR